MTRPMKKKNWALMAVSMISREGQKSPFDGLGLGIEKKMEKIFSPTLSTVQPLLV